MKYSKTVSDEISSVPVTSVRETICKTYIKIFFQVVQKTLGKRRTGSWWQLQPLRVEPQLL